MWCVLCVMACFTRANGIVPINRCPAYMLVQQYASPLCTHAPLYHHHPPTLAESYMLYYTQGLPSTVALDSTEGPGFGDDTTRHAKAHRFALARRRPPSFAPLQAPPPPPLPRSDRGSDDDMSDDGLPAGGGPGGTLGVAPQGPLESQYQLPMTIADKVRLCVATEKDRVMFGKVGGVKQKGGGMVC